MEELDLELFLNRFKNQHVDFYRFPGNYGDSLIWHGTKLLLARLNISEHYVEIDSPKKFNTLFVDGGGNLIDYYTDVRNFLTKKSNLYEEIVILPHTIFGPEQVKVLNQVNSKLSVFCREKQSANNLINKLEKSKVFLWHDCAFYNDFKHLWRDGDGTAYFFRKDRESHLNLNLDNNTDISLNGWAKKPLENFLEAILQYSEVHTDRLHVAIAATLLNKKVYVYPNSYYKNKAVYQYSLKNFSNTQFRDSL